MCSRGRAHAVATDGPLRPATASRPLGIDLIAKVTRNCLLPWPYESRL